MANTPKTNSEVNAYLEQNSVLIRQIEQYGAVIFDMDGTLVDTELMHHAAWKHMAKDFGLKEELSSDLLWAYAGKPTEEISADICKRFGLSANPLEMTQAKCDIYREIYMPQGEPFPLFCALLKHLSASGKRIALATSSHAPEAEFLMNKAGLKPYIHAIISGDLVKNGKPNPDIFLLAAERLNMQPEHCLVFEDSKTGMLCAKNARMDAVKVFDGKFDCDHVISHDEPWEGRD